MSKPRQKISTLPIILAGVGVGGARERERKGRDGTYGE